MNMTKPHHKTHHKPPLMKPRITKTKDPQGKSTWVCRGNLLTAYGDSPASAWRAYVVHYMRRHIAEVTPIKSLLNGYNG